MKKNKNLSELMGYAGKHKYLTYASLILSVISAFLALLPFVFIFCIIKEVIEVTPNFSEAVNIVRNGWLAVLFALISIVIYISGLMCSHLSAFRIAGNMRKSLMSHIAKLPLGFIGEMGSGKIRRIVNDSSAATETYLAHQLPGMAGAIATPLDMIIILNDNRSALDAGWDDELLAVEMEELQNLGFDLGLTGFDEKELADLFASNEDAKQDDFDVDAELEKPCFSKSGDVWHLGRHTIICGDSTLPETYTALLGDTKVNLVCTDPLYLVNLESTSGKIKNDDLDDEKGYEFLKSAFERFHETMAKDASIYVFYATSKARVFYDAYEDAGFKVDAGLVWKKDRLVLTRTDWKYIHEPIIWG